MGNEPSDAQGSREHSACCAKEKAEGAEKEEEGEGWQGGEGG